MDATAKLDQPHAWWVTSVAPPRGAAPIEGEITARVELPAGAPVQPYFSIKLKDPTTTFQKNRLGRSQRRREGRDRVQARAQGCHTLVAADVDGDGRDEIILGSVALRPDGKVLWNLGLGHPDIMYAADVIPTRPGLEIAFGYEVRQEKNGLCLVDARTGEIIWGHPYKTTHLHDQGMIGDFIPEAPGMEFYGAEQDGTGKWACSAANGQLITEEDLGGLSPRAIWWGADSTKAYIPGRTFGGGRGGGGGGRRGGSSAGVPPAPTNTATPAITIPTGAPTNNAANTGATPPTGTGHGGPGAFGFDGPSSILRYGSGKIGEFEGRLIAIADLLGDWHEEIVVSLPGEIRIYTTTIPTARRRVTLIQDPLYRKNVAHQTMGYFYPPQLSYHFR